MQLVSIQVGKPQTLPLPGENEKTWRSAIYKASVSGRVYLGATNLDGDKQAATRVHGGPDKAVCCFASEHYPYWQEATGKGEAFAHGAFGENFTFAGLLEANVCIGDVYEVGEAIIQVSQPRQPCINLVRKWGVSEMIEQMIETDQTGFYLRVLQTGFVSAGDTVTLQKRLYPELTVVAANAAMYRKEGGQTLAARLAELPELAESWRKVFRKRLPNS